MTDISLSNILNGGKENFITNTFRFLLCFSLDVIKEQNRELRGTQRAISRDRAALEKQEKQLVSRTLKFSLTFQTYLEISVGIIS